MRFIKIIFFTVVFCNIAVDISHKILLQNIVFKVFDDSEQVLLISLINALILIPFILLFSLSGFLSDKYDKKNILIYGSLSSLLLSLFMIVPYTFGNFNLAMIGLLLLAVQSAVYSPAKFGLIISLYKKEQLSKGNAYLQSISMLAILVNMALFSFLFESMYSHNHLELITSKEVLLQKFTSISYYIVIIALFEFCLSWFVLKRTHLEVITNSNLIFNKTEYLKAQVLKRNLKSLCTNKVVFLSTIGLGTFWGISQGLLAVFPAFCKEYLGITNVFTINLMLASSGVGIAVGSIFYSKLSKNYIEVGTIPFGAIGMTSMIFFATIVSSTWALFLCFFLFGFFGGMFVVPLNALIQFNAKKKKLGLIIAGNNWVQSLFMLIILVLTTVVSYFKFDSLSTLYILLVITLIGSLYTVFKFPQSLVYFFVKFIVGLKYDLEVVGLNNIPSNQGVLLLGNHVSWIDWAIIQMSMPREIKFVMDKSIYNKWYLKWFLKLFHVVPIASTSSKQSIKKIAHELDSGNVIVLFPEGAITRNGHLGEFKRGFELILHQTQKEIPVVAFYIRGLWESMFSRANQKLIDTYRTNSVAVTFSKPIKKQDAKAEFVKHTIMNLTIKSWQEHVKLLEPIPCEVFNSMKEVKNELIVADSTGMELSAHKFLTISILFSKLLKSKIKNQNIGLLIPSSAAGAFINTSVLMLGKTAVNLNYTSDVNTLIQSCENANIKSIITSKKFIEKLKEKGFHIEKLFEHTEVLYLEDLKKAISKLKAILILLAVKTLPTKVLKSLFIKKRDIETTALIVFSSGSEGVPKGIELSHMNIVGNIQQIKSILNFNYDDGFVASLPLFHSFGICVTTFLPLLEGIKLIAHTDPTDGYELGKLIYKYKASIMCGSSTFLRLYCLNKKVNPLMFESLRYVIAGAEKLSSKVREDFKLKFGKEILEGYGATETSPVASCNLPNILTPEYTIQRGNKIGSVGMPIPGTSIKIVDPDTFEDLEIGEEGMILIGGVQVMKGYLNNEAKTQKVIKSIDGTSWYVTGDKGKYDSDGFLHIVDRYSRFAKLGGEMVSLSSVEQKLRAIINKDEIDFLATALKDDKKGEKIIMLITNINEEELSHIKHEVIKSFENKLMIPQSFKIVDEIPKLGSGKTDFSKAKALAMSL